MELEVGVRSIRAAGGLTFSSAETEAVFLVFARLPGFKKDEIEIWVDEAGTGVRISGGERRESVSAVISRRLAVSREVTVGGFQEDFPIPSGAVLERIEAAFDEEEEILIILVPKFASRGLEISSDRGKEEEATEPPPDEEEFHGVPNPEATEEGTREIPAPEIREEPLPTDTKVPAFDEGEENPILEIEDGPESGATEPAQQEEPETSDQPPGTVPLIRQWEPEELDIPSLREEDEAPFVEPPTESVQKPDDEPEEEPEEERCSEPPESGPEEAMEPENSEEEKGAKIPLVEIPNEAPEIQLHEERVQEPEEAIEPSAEPGDEGGETESSSSSSSGDEERIGEGRRRRRRERGEGRSSTLYPSAILAGSAFLLSLLVLAFHLLRERRGQKLEPPARV